MAWTRILSPLTLGARTVAVAQDNVKLTPIELFTAAFTIGSFAGVARLLNSNESLGLRVLLAAILKSGIAALTISLLLHNFYGTDNPYALLGVSALAGMGAIDIVDIASVVMSRMPALFAVMFERGAKRDDR